jgi:hypothetical protein
MSGRRRTHPATPTGTDERREYLQSVFEALWPEPTTIAANGTTAATGKQHEYVVVPNVRRPTLVLPLRPRRVTAAGLRHYKTSANASTRLKLQLLALGAQVGLADLLPDRIKVNRSPRGPDAGIEGYLSDALNREVLVSLYVGPNRAIQKPVLQLLSPRGETLGFAKVGTNELTRELVRGEAQALTSLNAARWKRLTVPTMLHHGIWRGHEVLVQEPLAGSRRAKADPSLLTEAMLELASSSGVEVAAVTGSRYWKRLGERVGQLPPSVYADLLAHALREISALAADTRLDLGSWHGDWAPWNMAASGDRLRVWDWEQYAHPAPLGFDALHYRIQTLVVSDRRTPDVAVETTGRDAADLLTPFAVPHDLAPLVMLMYVVDIAARYLHDGEHEAGTRMGNLDSWLSAALERQLRAISEAR